MSGKAKLSTRNEAMRLKEGRAQSIETSSIHLDIVRDLERINSHLTSVAYPIVEAAGELAQSRLLDPPAVAAEPTALHLMHQGDRPRHPARE
jgi:hypothetical protein